MKEEMPFRPSTLYAAVARAVSGEPAWRAGPGEIVATLYEDGAIAAASPSARDMIGAAGDLAGRSLFDFIARDDRAPVRAALAHAAERGKFADPARLAVPFSLLRVRRAAAPAEIVFRPLGGRKVSALIRERVPGLLTMPEAAAPQADHADDNGAPLTEAAPAPASQSPSLSQSQSTNPGGPPPVDLMADLAHEMKTPLNAIMGFADAMRAETYGPLGADIKGAKKYAEYIGHIHAAGAHLTSLIAAAQDFAKTQAGRYAIHREATDPGAILSECAAMIGGSVDAAGLKLIVRRETELDEALLDPRAIRQILINLLSNAVKFTEDGEIELSLSECAGGIEYKVRDTGVGMSKVVLAKLGGRWSDTHKDGVRGAGGSGLGLSLAFELARLHGGTLEFASAPGEGTTATLFMPTGAGAVAPGEQADVQSQLDRVNAYRRERQSAA
ncbi:MAG: PAS domain-containing sensor histidine kinase [Pseudomonadota bacterium]